MDEDLCMDLCDIMSFNTYPAWYNIAGSDPNQEEFSRDAVERSFKIIKDFASQEKFNKRPVLVSEIGAEALPGDHSGLRWSEDYQADLITTVLEMIEKDEILQGVFLWMYCDSKTYSNPGGQARARGYNNKGLLDEYRRPKLSWQRAGKLLKKQS
jgi:beta-glucuronidase